jgi:hypothetical protein
MRFLFSLLGSSFLSLFPFAQSPFTEGNIIVVRVGSPDTTLNNQGREVFLQEYSPQGALVQVVPIPATGDQPFTISGTSTLEGMLHRSANGAYLSIGGYQAPRWTASLSSGTANANRVIARIGKNAQVDRSTVCPQSNLYPGASFRAAVSNDGNQFWTAGGTGGVRYVPFGFTESLLLSSTVTNSRNVGIFGGQLYVVHSSGTVNTRVMKVGDGLPVAGLVDAQQMPGLPVGTNALSQIFMADLNTNIAGYDVLYIADESGGILKYSLQANNEWVANGSVGTGGDQYRAITGYFGGNTVTLYATRRGGNNASGGGELVSLADNTGHNNTIIAAEPTLLAKAETGTAFRGVALAPMANAAGSTDTYIFTGNNGNWNETGNWLNGLIPPAVLPPSFEIVIRPAAEDLTIVIPQQTIQAGAKLTIAAGKKVKLEGNLVME